MQSFSYSSMVLLIPSFYRFYWLTSLDHVEVHPSYAPGGSNVLVETYNLFQTAFLATQPSPIISLAKTVAVLTL
jgi:hypothetical protein